jgi:hypothetical protein
MEIKASSFKLRANAPKGQKRFPISQLPTRVIDTFIFTGPIAKT